MTLMIIMVLKLGAVCLLLMAGFLLFCYGRALVLARKYPFLELYKHQKATDNYICADEISPVALLYAVKLEDSNYYNHPGYDVNAIKYAIQINMRSRSIRHGASTITQQLVKNLYFSFSKSVSRKVTEIFLAVMMEKVLTKDQILELYLNVIYYGNGQWGIGNAAKYYFDKRPASITNNQALFLLTLLPAPTWSNPLLYPERYISRRDRSLDMLISFQGITPEEAEKIKVRYTVNCLDEELQDREVPPDGRVLPAENPLTKDLRMTVRKAHV